MSWYQIQQMQMRTDITPVNPVKHTSNDDFHAIIKENQRKEFFKNKKKMKVFPKTSKDANGKIIKKLMDKKEIELFAELTEKGNIGIFCKIKNGNICFLFDYEDLSMFLKDFETK